jgi:uncharacterized RDD family membrane protein YckC
MADDARRSRLGAAGRLAFFPARAAARASRAPLESAADEHLVPELSRLADRALMGTLPEEIAKSVAEHHLLERIVAKLAETGELDRAVEKALASPRTKELADRVVRSDVVRAAIQEVVAGPEVRAALTQQTTGLGEELAADIRERGVRLDDKVQRAVGHTHALGAAGIVTRALAFAVDAFLIVAIFTVLSGFMAVISSLVGTLRPAWLVELLLAGGGALVAGGYLVFFWSAAGRTPGMYLLRLRVQRPGGSRPSVWRAIVRTLGTWIAIVPFFAGYLPVLFDERGRGLPDFLAGTEVVYDSRSGE